MQSITIGQKIKNFRIQKGFSQQDLELAINAAPGSISRMEADKVNPTKETLLAIANVLGLSKTMQISLLGIESAFPTRVEIEKAITEAHDCLASPIRLAYIMDEFGRLQAVSKGFIQILGLTTAQVIENTGRNIIELILDHKLPVRGAIDPAIFDNFAALEIRRYVDEYGEEMIRSFIHDDYRAEFEKLLAWGKTIPNDVVISPSNKFVTFIVAGQKINLQFARERLKQNARFELIEFFPSGSGGIV